jgi:hypothetical protein
VKTQTELVKFLEGLDWTENENQVEILKQIALLSLAGFPTQVVGRDGPVDIVIRQPNVARQCVMDIRRISQDKPKAPPVFEVSIVMADPIYDNAGDRIEYPKRREEWEKAAEPLPLPWL